MSPPSGLPLFVDTALPQTDLGGETYHRAVYRPAGNNRLPRLTSEDHHSKDKHSHYRKTSARVSGPVTRSHGKKKQIFTFDHPLFTYQALAETLERDALAQPWCLSLKGEKPKRFVALVERLYNAQANCGVYLSNAKIRAEANRNKDLDQKLQEASEFTTVENYIDPHPTTNSRYKSLAAVLKERQPVQELDTCECLPRGHSSTTRKDRHSRTGRTLAADAN